ncbi:conserved hypothetical protein [Ricinus communis]|uniref:Uncharacterized protein n=1 Tax=Ricinus communis TaxID=3988 RepID=B9TEU1_RICCO|nr:conserved hypothetical protein [Ricinus communis]
MARLAMPVRPSCVAWCWARSSMAEALTSASPTSSASRRPYDTGATCSPAPSASAGAIRPCMARRMRVPMRHAASRPAPSRPTVASTSARSRRRISSCSLSSGMPIATVQPELTACDITARIGVPSSVFVSNASSARRRMRSRTSGSAWVPTKRCMSVVRATMRPLRSMMLDGAEALDRDGGRQRAPGAIARGRRNADRHHWPLRHRAGTAANASPARAAASRRRDGRCSSAAGRRRPPAPR